MSEKSYMKVDGIRVEIAGERNLLEVARKAGVEMPTFCYHSELSIYGACRMCVVEIEGAGLEASCSAQPRAGMSIHTNTVRLRRYRKNILEMLLANHCRDCTTCEKSRQCKLQELALRFNLDDVRFPNKAMDHKIDDQSLCLTRDSSKCILCGDCIRMCNEIQGVGAIDFAGRGASMRVSAIFDKPLAESGCVGCGQCARVCPTGAIVVKNDSAAVWRALEDKNSVVSVQIAPAVRVALGDAFGLEGDCSGLIVAALRRIGFDVVYDTATGADLTVIEEASELMQRVKEKKALPLFSSCCPAWVTFCEQRYPELLNCVSSCRSPMQMLASLIRETEKNAKGDDEIKYVHVAIMPCTAKKAEAARSEFRAADAQDVDHVLTTLELIRMIREAGIVFSELESEALDYPLGLFSGAGVIFGAAGGVTEAVLRYITGSGNLSFINYEPLAGLEGVKTLSLALPEEGEAGNAAAHTIRIAVVSGLHNADELIKHIKAGKEQFDFVEVMSCPSGCINGGGQPAASPAACKERGHSLYAADKRNSIKRSDLNPVTMELYKTVLKGERAHELLHVRYGSIDKKLQR
ncbi:hydrogenase-1 [Treponema primitia ZAS-2]|uniref:HndA2 n=1 Tax=Treponema primitia (strain ATCC BAA-887 / DSM 12427 / ZAS-2) TaxID=545694 RepID=F5YKC7_TREPZ|nr:[FeFe] hydrogenase, group A [Treponema primitia]AEF86023.1 hydrogenase-1 [Treponema primitia ZAS-2]AEL20827.1 HndA2 [Treponema primitia ZAS-2]